MPPTTLLRTKVMSRRLLSGIGLLVLLACTSQFLSAQSTSQQKIAKEKASAESTLAREVRHQLAVLPYLSVFDHVDFALDGSKVTLAGQVLRPALKHDAAASMQSIEGIGRVVNEIEVLPQSPSDDEMRRAIYRAIFEDPVLQKYAVQALPTIRIIVKNGNAALEGFVESDGDKKLAASRASGVANLHELKDNLAVRGKAGGSGGQ